MAFKAANRVSSETSCCRALKSDDEDRAPALRHGAVGAGMFPDTLLLLFAALLLPFDADNSSAIPLALDGPAICLSVE